jgi:hypothetical protein
MPCECLHLPKEGCRITKADMPCDHTICMCVCVCVCVCVSASVSLTMHSSKQRSGNQENLTLHPRHKPFSPAHRPGRRPFHAMYRKGMGYCAAYNSRVRAQTHTHTFAAPKLSMWDMSGKPHLVSWVRWAVPRRPQFLAACLLPETASPAAGRHSQWLG